MNRASEILHTHNRLPWQWLQTFHAENKRFNQPDWTNLAESAITPDDFKAIFEGITLTPEVSATLALYFASPEFKTLQVAVARIHLPNEVDAFHRSKIGANITGKLFEDIGFFYLAQSGALQNLLQLPPTTWLMSPTQFIVFAQACQPALESRNNYGLGAWGARVNGQGVSIPDGCLVDQFPDGSYILRGSVDYKHYAKAELDRLAKLQVEEGSTARTLYDLLLTPLNNPTGGHAIKLQNTQLYPYHTVFVGASGRPDCQISDIWSNTPREQNSTLTLPIPQSVCKRIRDYLLRINS